MRRRGWSSSRCSCSPAASPVLYIDINAPGGKRMPLAVADFAVGPGDPSRSREIPKILSDDLALTDLFDLIPPTAHMETVTAAHFSGKPLSFPGWKMIGAEAVVIGKLEAQGDRVSIEMRLYDATQGTLLVGKRYTGTPTQVRSIAHRFANEIVYTFTGVRGVFGTEIAFTARSGTSKGKELYLVGMDGQEMRRVTDNRSSTSFPAGPPTGNGWRTRRTAPACPPSTCATSRPGRRRRSSGSGDEGSRGILARRGVAVRGRERGRQLRHLPGPGGGRCRREGRGRVGDSRSPLAVPRRSADRLRLRPRRFPRRST